MGITTKLVFFLPVILCFTSGQGTASSPRQCSESLTQQGEMTRGSWEDWDILVLTQSWPPATCLLLEGGFEKCNITSLRSWVIHGLWPTKPGTRGPNFCNDSSAFDPSEVQVLQPRLGLNWPSVEKGDDPVNLWTHEWCKHGTCGMSLPALKGELHYFNTTLNLHDHFNLTVFLSSNNITPSNDKAYTFDDIVNTLKKKAGSSPSLACARSKSSGKCYLEQVELCLTKSFEPTDCVDHHHHHPSLPSRSGKLHDLLFQSEKGIARRGRHGSPCSCETEDVYYMPFPSV